MILDIGKKSLENFIKLIIEKTIDGYYPIIEEISENDYCPYKYKLLVGKNQILI